MSLRKPVFAETDVQMRQVVKDVGKLVFTLPLQNLEGKVSNVS